MKRQPAGTPAGAGRRRERPQPEDCTRPPATNNLLRVRPLLHLTQVVLPEDERLCSRGRAGGRVRQQRSRRARGGEVSAGGTAHACAAHPTAPAALQPAWARVRSATQQLQQVAPSSIPSSAHRHRYPPGRLSASRHITQPSPGYTRPYLWPAGKRGGRGSRRAGTRVGARASGAKGRRAGLWWAGRQTCSRACCIYAARVVHGLNTSYRPHTHLMR